MVSTEKNFKKTCTFLFVELWTIDSTHIVSRVEEKVVCCACTLTNSSECKELDCINVSKLHHNVLLSMEAINYVPKGQKSELKGLFIKDYKHSIHYLQIQKPQLSANALYLPWKNNLQMINLNLILTFKICSRPVTKCIEVLPWESFLAVKNIRVALYVQFESSQGRERFFH